MLATVGFAGAETSDPLESAITGIRKRDAYCTMPRATRRGRNEHELAYMYSNRPCVWCRFRIDSKSLIWEEMSMIVVNGWALIAFAMALVALAINLSTRGK